MPTGGGSNETMIAEMIITVGGGNVKDYPGKKFFEVYGDPVIFSAGIDRRPCFRAAGRMRGTQQPEDAVQKYVHAYRSL